MRSLTGSRPSCIAYRIPQSDFYSGFHPVQSIQRHLQTVNEHERSREQRSVKGEQQRKERDAQHGGKPPSEERIEAGQAQGQGQAHEEQKQKQDPSKKDETGRSSAWREVQDPVTRRLVRQRDVTDEEFRKGMEEAKSYQSGLRAFQSGNGRSGDEKDGKDGKVLHTAGGIRPPQYDTTTPLRTQGDNALLYPLPPAPEDTYALKTLVPSLRRRAHWALLCWSVCALAVLPSATTVLFLLFTNAAVVIGLHVAQRRLEDGLQRERLAREEARGEEVEKAAMPEGAEWLNGVLRGLWPLVNPDLFESVADTLEDVLQVSRRRSC